VDRPIVRGVPAGVKRSETWSGTVGITQMPPPGPRRTCQESSTVSFQRANVAHAAISSRRRSNRSVSMIRRLGLVFQRVGQGRFADGTGGIRALCRPVSKAGPEPVRRHIVAPHPPEPGSPLGSPRSAAPPAHGARHRPSCARSEPSTSASKGRPHFRRRAASQTCGSRTARSTRRRGGDDFVVARHHDHRPVLQPFGQVHRADGDVTAGRLDVLVQNLEGESRLLLG
jgi:hypothetical protein